MIDIDYVNELNCEQLDVVLHGDGPCLVLAGAGSGKTRVITYRVAYLLEQGVKPENILLVTFTNKAAREMVERVGKLTDGEGRKFSAPTLNTGTNLPWAGTFHHIAYRILKKYASLIGYKSNFTILDSEDSSSLIKQCLKELKPAGSNRFPSASALQAVISFARNAEIPLAKLLEDKYYQWSYAWDAIQEIAKLYEKKKKEANVMDFDDLLVNWLRVLDASPHPTLSTAVEKGRVTPSVATEGGGGGIVNSLLNKLATQFHYILVDEYQDTNKIQASIIKKLSSAHNNVLVVGDDAQSIYSFRAADIDNILRFERDYPGAKIYRLETNYRSTEEILGLANNVIANNIRQHKKKLRPVDVGARPALLKLRRGRHALPLRPSLHPQMDQLNEAQFVIKEINKLLADNVESKNIAVLFRAVHHSQMLELALAKAGIPYDYRGGLRFFERAHIKDVLAYLRIINNLGDSAAWMRVLTREEGIGTVGANRILEILKKYITNIEQILTFDKEMIGSKAQMGWKNFLEIFNQLLEADKAPASLIQTVLDSRYKEYLEDEYADSRERMDDLKQLLRFAEEQTDLDTFLSEASLQEQFRKGNVNNPPAVPLRKGDMANYPLLMKEGQGEVSSSIILSTIHQAKGLEWDAVFIINLASGGFPNEKALQEEKGMEEERRLFYVAITRARRHLYLTYPMSGRGDFLTGPSMFLQEIDSDLIEDHSFLSRGDTVFDSAGDDELTYIAEDKPLRIKPGSFLREIEDL